MSRNQKIILTRGLPASGKSTWSIEHVKQSKGTAKRVNKDDLRSMIDAGVWSKPNESFILAARNAIVEKALDAGYNTVIVDDTNFEHSHFEKMQEIAANAASVRNSPITVEYKEFNTPLDECIHRDAVRANSVGEKVIKDMHARHIAPKVGRSIGKNVTGNAVIFDIDGTTAWNDGHRGWFEWDKVINDKPIIPILNLARMYHAVGYTVIFVSGREGTATCREQTLKWLEANNVPHHALYMRKEKDFRRDNLIKEEIYNTYIKDVYEVEAVYDDRDQVVDFWRSIGLKCLQCEPGDF